MGAIRHECPDVLFSRLSPAEIERLALLAEEMGEAIQVIGKILRHGYESCHPNGGPRNRELLEKELGDVRAAMMIMVKANDLCLDAIWAHEENKEKNVQRYLHHQQEDFA
jgi:NTP pyrophosphatase (non-canonical NTP hydrolase)